MKARLVAISVALVMLTPACGEEVSTGSERPSTSASSPAQSEFEAVVTKGQLTIPSPVQIDWAPFASEGFLVGRTENRQAAAIADTDAKVTTTVSMPGGWLVGAAWSNGEYLSADVYRDCEGCDEREVWDLLLSSSTPKWVRRTESPTPGVIETVIPQGDLFSSSEKEGTVSIWSASQQSWKTADLPDGYRMTTACGSSTVEPTLILLPVSVPVEESLDFDKVAFARIAQDGSVQTVGSPGGDGESWRVSCSGADMVLVVGSPGRVFRFDHEGDQWVEHGKLPESLPLQLNYRSWLGDVVPSASGVVFQGTGNSRPLRIQDGGVSELLTPSGAVPMLVQADGNVVVVDPDTGEVMIQEVSQ